MIWLWITEAIGYAHAIKIEALAKLGKILRNSTKAKGKAGPGRGKAGVPAGLAFNEAPTLSDLGITRKASGNRAEAGRAP